MEEQNIVELIDEDGNVVEFEHLATIEHEGEYYIALVAADESDDEETEVVIMKIEGDEDNETYVPVEDDALQAVIFEKFIALMGEEDA